MNQLDDRTRIQTAQADADRHGYSLTVEEALNMPAPITHVAFANPVVAEGEGSLGRFFLCYSNSVADAAEAGVEIIRRHVELDEPWPEELLGKRMVRDLNDRAYALLKDLTAAHGEFHCECGDAGCEGVVVLSLPEFEALRARGGRVWASSAHDRSNGPPEAA
jgi:hypothetical protein